MKDDVVKPKHLQTLVEALAIIFIAIEVLKSLASGTLLAWHIYLAKHGITTYQYLVEKEQVMKLKSEFAQGKMSEEEFVKMNSKITEARQLNSVHKIKKSKVIVYVKPT